MWWFYALLSAFFAALTAIFAKIGVQHISSNLATAIRTMVVLVLTWVIVLTRGEHVGLTSVSQKTLFFLLLSGLATGLSWICYFKALQLGKASMVAPIDKSSLVMVLILAAIFLGEPLSVKAICGVLLIVGGMIVLVL
jgi:transporter family protein